MDLGLHGCAALVTGASEGLGFAVAQQLVREGAAQGIRVNGVHPGPVETSRLAYLIEQRASALGISPEAARQQLIEGVSLGRPGRREEIADAITFLVSDRASFVTGAMVQVDGGKIKCL